MNEEKPKEKIKISVERMEELKKIAMERGPTVKTSDLTDEEKASGLYRPVSRRKRRQLDRQAAKAKGFAKKKLF